MPCVGNVAKQQTEDDRAHLSQGPRDIGQVTSLEAQIRVSEPPWGADVTTSHRGPYPAYPVLPLPALLTGLFRWRITTEGKKRACKLASKFAS